VTIAGTVARVAVLAILLAACERAQPAATEPSPAEVGGCVALEDRVIRGVLHAAKDRHAADLAGAERDLHGLLHGLCLREGWLVSVLGGLGRCDKVADAEQRKCARDAMAPIFAHQREVDDIVRRHQ
jgi:hypothetical protein